MCLVGTLGYASPHYSDYNIAESLKIVGTVIFGRFVETHTLAYEYPSRMRTLLKEFTDTENALLKAIRVQLAVVL